MPDGGKDGVRRGRKVAQVLDGARQVFMAQGFEGASVDDIARAAGVSKATLYSYFPDKRRLFIEVAATECARQTDMAVDSIDRTAPPRVVLTLAARQMVEFLISDFGQQMFRVSVAEAERFPDVGRAFHASGPATIRARLVDWLREATANGLLRIEDFDLAADQFQELAKADIFARAILNVSRTFSEAEKTRVIDGAVEMFMARYGA